MNRGTRVLDRAAHRAVVAVDQAGGQLGGHPVQPLRPQVQPVLAGVVPGLATHLCGVAGADEGRLQPGGGLGRLQRRLRRGHGGLQGGEPHGGGLRLGDDTLLLGEAGRVRLGRGGGGVAGSGELGAGRLQPPDRPGGGGGTVDVGQQCPGRRGRVAQLPGDRRGALASAGDRRPCRESRPVGLRRLLGGERGAARRLQHVAERLGAPAGVALGAERHQGRFARLELAEFAGGAVAAGVALVDGPGGGQFGVGRARLLGRAVGLLLRGDQAPRGRGPHGGDPRRHVAARASADELGRERLRDVDVGDLGHPRQQRAQPRLALGHPLAGRGPLLRQPLLGLREASDVEQRAQQFGAVLGLGAQEAREVALGQQHHLAELVDVEAQAGAQVLGALVDPGADRLPAPVGAAG